ncbi:M20/M25/M40 family metallo-hydrolase [Sphingobacterium psychroaquaticum]|uniref:M28 family metallopeptidase n=1 Tax=Sphingobacterium psychroaquaticum TaxID=561061 RepID=UPI00106A03D7|nr:M28 family metallopeptidase [Sphingobacterium psychroaquaticum]QBQ40341.1 M20/M25/M40 family metallo-hydrolase [Sphingobacterium psychroaquaticum]
MKKTILFGAALAALTTACHLGENSAHDTSSLDSTALAAITEAAYKNYVLQLSSDEFMGRKPFTKGDTLTVNYIEKQFKELGLSPGNGDSYFQEVPLVEISSKPVNPVLTFQGAKGTLSINNLDDYVIGSRRLQEQIQIDQSDLVFVGFGIVAPEYNWNDYAGLDVKGKTVVAMVSDPGRYDKTLFKADTMTYYGRWKYKYEEAARQGAKGILLIHEKGAASYDWNVVRSGWSGPQLELITENDGADFAAFEGWISNSTASKLFALAGLPKDIQEQAKKPGFKAVPMPVTTSFAIKNTFRKSKSNNVIAKIEGSKRPDETIIYTAHWDHLGIGEAVNGDSIYNGAIDNASGVAALFEVAKAFKAAKVKPERTIVFMAVTSEEEGLLGSAYYAQHPIFPLQKTVANINMDAFSPLGATKDVSVVGIGQTELEDYVQKSAAKFGRTMAGERNPTSGGFYRSDHFNFVKAGVPGLFMGSGSELIEQDSTIIRKRVAALSGRYHTVADQVDENWDFGGILADVKLFFDIGYTLSLEKTFPNFKAKSEFKELGDKRLAK